MEAQSAEETRSFMWIGTGVAKEDNERPDSGANLSMMLNLVVAHPWRRSQDLTS